MEGSYTSMASSKGGLARKSMHSPLFSKEAVRRSEHLITDMLAKFFKVLSDCSLKSRSVDLTMGYKCIAADVAMNYAFQRPLNTLDAEGFQSEVLTGTEAFARMFHWPLYFPNVFECVVRVAAYLPMWFLSRFMKPFTLVNWCLAVSSRFISQC